MDLIVSSSPHFRAKASTQSIMRDVLIALAPCVIAGGIFFGVRALLVVLVTTAVAVLAEFVSRLVMKRKNTISDCSAAVTGVILGLILPPTVNFFVAAFGSIVAVVAVKQMFGGIGNNFVNPACTARVVLLASFAKTMTTWVSPFAYQTGGMFFDRIDALTTASPLVSGNASYLDLFLGNTAGSIGETSALAILIGFVYLCVRRVISPVIPAAFVGSAALMALVCGQDVLYTLLSGGLLFGAVFMATDYATSPLSLAGKIIYGCGLGFFTLVIRVYGNLPEGVSYAIVLMNIVTPLLDSAFTPKPFGYVKPPKKEAKHD